MTTIITGSNGFSGFYLAEYLKSLSSDILIGIDLQPNNNNKFIDVYYSTAEFQSFSKYIEEINNDIRFFHLSGLIGSLPLPELINANVYWTSKYLEVIKNIKNLKIFVNIGSSAEYGLQSEMTLQESLITHPVTNYGISKDIQSKLVLHFGRIFNVPVVSTRTFNLIGPGLSEKLVAGKIVKEINQIASGRKTNMELGRLDSKRDFIDIRDAVKIYFQLSEKPPIGEIVNVARGKSHQISEILEICKKVKNIDPPVKLNYYTDKKQDLDFQYADIIKLQSIVGKINYIPFEKTIKDMLEIK